MHSNSLNIWCVFGCDGITFRKLCPCPSAYSLVPTDRNIQWLFITTATTNFQIFFGSILKMLTALQTLTYWGEEYNGWSFIFQKWRNEMEKPQVVWCTLTKKDCDMNKIRVSFNLPAQTTPVSYSAIKVVLKCSTTEVPLSWTQFITCNFKRSSRLNPHDCYMWGCHFGATDII